MRMLRWHDIAGDQSVIDNVVQSGYDVVEMNFNHGTVGGAENAC